MQNEVEMCTSSSDQPSQFRNISFKQEIVGVEMRNRKGPRRPAGFFSSFASAKIHTIYDVDNVKSAHLIKLVQAVQSLKRKKYALM